MKLKARNLMLITATLLIAVFPLTAREPRELTVTIDGITGKVEFKDENGKTDNTTMHAGDKVKVVLKRANLIHYGYTIESAGVDLTQKYFITGFPSSGVLESLKANNWDIQDKFLEFVSPEQQSFSQEDLNKEIKELLEFLETVDSFTRSMTEAIDAVEELEALGNRVWNNEAKWPTIDVNDVPVNVYTNQANKYLDQRKRFLDGLPEKQKTINKKSRELSILAAVIKSGIVTLEPSTLDKDTISDFISQNLVTGYKGLSFSDLIQKINETTIKIRRWQAIIQSHPEAKLETTYRVERENKKYTVKIYRKALTETAKSQDNRAFGQPAVTPQVAADNGQVLATFTYEVHAFSRLNASIGVAAVFTPEKRTHEIKPGLDGGNNLIHTIRETERNDWEFKPIFQIGAYLNREIDDFDPNRKVAFMITAGAEIKDSPDQYFAGFAWDFPQGVILGVGLTHFKQQDLFEDFQVGQEIPTKDDGNPLIATLPTHEEDEFGFYANVSFRPAIFKAIWKLRKGE